MAFGSTRVIATYGVIGQAIGTAAAMTVEHSLMPREVNEHIKELQCRLLKDDCYLFGIKDTDSTNLALKTCVSASSEQEGFEAVRVVNGYQGNIRDHHNLWISEPLNGESQSISLKINSTHGDPCARAWENPS